MTNVHFPGLPEARAGAESLDALQAERLTLVRQSAALATLYGPFGMWDTQRKRRLSVAELKVRNEAADRSEKVTDKAVDALAHVDPEYVAFLERSLVEKADYLVLQVQIDALTERIRSRETDMYFVRAEMGLAR
jgi:hypothetical protein